MPDSDQPHQAFWLVNRLLVYYFKCNVLLPLYKNSSAEIARTGKQETWTEITLQWPSLYSWETAEIPPSLVSTRRRGKGSRGRLVPVGCFPQNNPKYVALSCFSVLFHWLPPFPILQSNGALLKPFYWYQTKLLTAECHHLVLSYYVHSSATLKRLTFHILWINPPASPLVGNYSVRTPVTQNCCKQDNVNVNIRWGANTLDLPLDFNFTGVKGYSAWGYVCIIGQKYLS